jgi:hypothetical protein
MHAYLSSPSGKRKGWVTDLPVRHTQQQQDDIEDPPRRKRISLILPLDTSAENTEPNAVSEIGQMNPFLLRIGRNNIIILQINVVAIEVDKTTRR